MLHLTYLTLGLHTERVFEITNRIDMGSRIREKKCPCLGTPRLYIGHTRLTHGHFMSRNNQQST